MIKATYTQFWMIFIIIFLFALNNLLINVNRWLDPHAEKDKGEFWMDIYYPMPPKRREKKLTQEFVSYYAVFFLQKKRIMNLRILILGA